MHHHPIKLLGLNLHTYNNNNKKEQHTDSTQHKLTVHFTGNKPGLGLGLHAKAFVDINIDSGRYKVKVASAF